MHYPDAISIGPNIDAVLFGGVDVSPIVSAYVLNGPHKGLSRNTLQDGGVAGGVDIGASFVITEYYYIGNINNFRIQDLQGFRVSGTLGFSIGIEVGAGALVAFPRPGEKIIGISHYVGVSPPGVSGNVNLGGTVE
jgi:hypothetical protein